MESFNRNLKQIDFRTFFHDQITTFDYGDLFASRRVLVFSVTNLYTTCTALYIKSFEQAYNNLMSMGIDNIYAIDSSDWLVGPTLDQTQVDIKGLPDRDMKFVSAVAGYANNNNNIVDLARHWQYMMLLNDGTPEKLWTAPFKKDTRLSILKSKDLRYYRLGPDKVAEYLLDNTEQTKYNIV